jgi:predicted dehydrogenase
VPGERKSMNTYKILVAGCGSIGQRHANLLSERQNIEVLLADPLEGNLTACTAKTGPRARFRDYEEALAHKPEGVFICTPNHLHAAMALKALDAGACVLVEKPVDADLVQAQQLARHQARDKVLVGYANRFDKLLQEMKKIIEAGTIGHIVCAHAFVYTYQTLLCAKTPIRERQEWTLVGDYSHEIDFLRYLAGEIKEVAAVAITGGKLDRLATPNVLEAILRFESGATGSLHIDYVRHPEKRFLEIVGDRGALELQMSKGILKVFTHEEKEPREISRPYVRDDLFRSQIDDFLAVLESRKTPLNTLENGLEVLKVTQALIQSAKTNTFVRV